MSNVNAIAITITVLMLLLMQSVRANMPNCNFDSGALAGCQCTSGVCQMSQGWKFEPNPRKVAIGRGGMIQLGSLVLAAAVGAPAKASLTGGGAFGAIFGLTSAGARGVFDAQSNPACFTTNNSTFVAIASALPTECTAVVGFCNAAGQHCCFTDDGCGTDATATTTTTTTIATGSSTTTQTPPESTHSPENNDATTNGGATADSATSSATTTTFAGSAAFAVATTGALLCRAGLSSWRN